MNQRYAGTLTGCIKAPKTACWGARLRDVAICWEPVRSHDLKGALTHFFRHVLGRTHGKCEDSQGWIL